MVRDRGRIGWRNSVPHFLLYFHFGMHYTKCITKPERNYHATTTYTRHLSNARHPQGSGILRQDGSPGQPRLHAEEHDGDGVEDHRQDVQAPRIQGSDC